MIRRLAFALLIWCAAITVAMAQNCGGVPNTFTPNTTILSSQVNANFTSLVNCANNNLAHNGANSDITSLTGLSTPLPVSEGGTAVATTTANLVFAGPTSGGAAAPSFRALVAADIPAGLNFVTGPGSSTNGDLALFNGATGLIIKDSGVTFPTVAAHQTLIATSATALAAKTVPDCVDTLGKHLNYTQSTDAYSCGTSTPTVTGTLTAGTAITMNPYALNSSATQAHGLGAIPAMVVCYLQNLTGELGYNSGDKAQAATGAGMSTGQAGWTVRTDATNTYLVTNANTAPALLNASSIITNITAANWELICTPYKIN